MLANNWRLHAHVISNKSIKRKNMSKGKVFRRAVWTFF